MIQNLFCSNFVIFCCFSHWYTITELFLRSKSGELLNQKVDYSGFFFNLDYSNSLEESGRSATVVPRISYNAQPIRYLRIRCMNPRRIALLNQKNQKTSLKDFFSISQQLFFLRRIFFFANFFFQGTSFLLLLPQY